MARTSVCSRSVKDENVSTAGPSAIASTDSVESAGQAPLLPDYLSRHYHWAYLSKTGRAVFDHSLMVHAILWGNMARLTKAVLSELSPGDKVLQPACVYGDFSVHLSKHLGEHGSLVVSDVAQVQAESAQRKLRFQANASVCVADAVDPPSGPYDKIVCYFLLHEVPDDYKRRIVDALTARLADNGKVVFVDYHRPRWWHPLRPVMALVFHQLEPFAQALCNTEIDRLSSRPEAFSWQKETFFGGLYQKVVVQKPSR